jgi:hypothetical protein
MTYFAKTRIEHAGVWYEVGAPLPDMHAVQIDALLALDAIEVQLDEPQAEAKSKGKAKQEDRE